MSKQISQYLILSSIVIGLIGCTTVTYPPPALQDAKYTSFEYQYSVDLPPGLEVHKMAPRDLAFILGGENSEEPKAVKLVLVNKRTESLIGIISKRLKVKYDDFLDASGKGLWKLGRDMGNELKRYIDISRFDYEINQGSLYDTQFKI